MKKTVSYILFAVIAIAVIWLGVWYNDQSSAANQAALQQVQQELQGAPSTTPSQAGQTTQSGATSTNTNSQNLTNSPMNELKIKDDVVGTGAAVQNGNTVSVLYTGSLDNGTVFDASSKHGNQPFSFTVGAGQVIQGWDLGLVGMKVGGTRELTIPPTLGYGSQSVSTIPPNSTLHFTIQLLSVSSTQQ
jgi:FKBP-type peptidyl-prolyl cis-trans isomerase